MKNSINKQKLLQIYGSDLTDKQILDFINVNIDEIKKKLNKSNEDFFDNDLILEIKDKQINFIIKKINIK